MRRAQAKVMEAQLVELSAEYAKAFARTPDRCEAIRAEYRALHARWLVTRDAERGKA